MLRNEDCIRRDDLSTILCERLDISHCSLYTPWGTRITSCADIAAGDSVFAVPEKRLFVLPNHGAGTFLDVLHIAQPTSSPILVEALVDSPRIYRLHNFLAEEEAQAMLADAQQQMVVDIFMELGKGNTDILSKTKKNGDPHHRRLSTSIVDTAGTEDEDEVLDAESWLNSLEANTGLVGKLPATSEIAAQLKRRAFDLLGVFPYDETFAEGWEIWKYDPGEGYDLHQDWLEPNFLATHDYNSAYEGTNRFAAVILTLSAAESGGEIVFPHLEATRPPVQRSQRNRYSVKAKKEMAQKAAQGSQIPGEPSKILETIENARRDHEETKDPTKKKSAFAASESDREETTEEMMSFVPNSWEDILSTQQCVQRFTVPPTGTSPRPLSEFMARGLPGTFGKGNGLAPPSIPPDTPQNPSALLVYLQKPNGLPDTQTLYGICPVLQGEQYLAVLWLWNGPKVGHWQRNSVTGRWERPAVAAVSASFEVVDLVAAKLYWEDQVWEELLPGKPIKVNTYSGHTWRVLLGEDIVAKWTIAADKPRQRFVLSAADIPTQYVPYRGP